MIMVNMYIYIDRQVLWIDRWMDGWTGNYIYTHITLIYTHTHIYIYIINTYIQAYICVYIFEHMQTKLLVKTMITNIPNKTCNRTIIRILLILRFFGILTCEPKRNFPIPFYWLLHKYSNILDYHMCHRQNMVYGLRSSILYWESLGI